MTATKQTSTLPIHRYTLVVDLDRCTGCGSCATSCAVETNIPPATERSNERTGVVWLRVHDVTTVHPSGRSTFVPIPCQQCEEPPCVDVCPQRAVEYDPVFGLQL